MKPMPPELQKLVEAITLDLIDHGKLIEFGWRARKKGSG